MSTTLARDVMTPNVQYVHPFDNVSQIAKVMVKAGISAVPVCDNGHIVGIISEGDLMAPFTEKRKLQRDWWLSILAEGTTLAKDFLEYIDAYNLTAQDLMKKDVIVGRADMTLAQIAQLLQEHHIKRVPIVENGLMVGIVSRADLIRSYAHGHS
ncbi:CBS domain-containing protein [Entomobacter blattae]|uniref:Hypoxic response protein 1 n=1 Tax=Entomobacter blattae TaxID=2762277 RepID=A0A7H1NUB9_9PROT|nr:CBS domain-containing protein [Entomobacter blattae]QNT79379.1 Hypoxic response protein 1 [Entomobacter blattae]